MITDKERQEVAQKLRNAEIDSCPGSVNGIPLGCIGVLFAKIVSPSEAEAKFAADRLADIIEPSESNGHECVPGECPLNVREMRNSTNEEQAEYDAMLEKMSVELHPVDRDALLKLADEMDEATCDNRGEMSVSLGDVWGWAECIREALGGSE